MSEFKSERNKNDKDVSKEDFHQNADCLSWLGALTSDSTSSLTEGSENQLHTADVDQLTRPSPNFLDDIITDPSSAAPTVCNMDYRRSNPRFSTRHCSSASFRSPEKTICEDHTAVSSIPPPKSRHYDDEDYRSHRHLVYPHVHQPLKAMEPRTLRRVRERLLAVRAALRPTADLMSGTASLPHAQTDLTPSCDPVVPPIPPSSSLAPVIDPERRLADLVDQKAVSTVACSDSDVEHHLDPSSPSLADKACALGQALKSRYYKADSWSISHPVSESKDVSCDARNSSMNTEVCSREESGEKESQGVSFVIPMGTHRVVERSLEGQMSPTKKQNVRYRRKRKSRCKPLSSTFQPSLTKLSEEGSPLSSSTTSSSLSLQLAESELVLPKNPVVDQIGSEHTICTGLEMETREMINLSNVSSRQTPSPSSASVISSYSETSNVREPVAPVVADPTEKDYSSDSTMSEANSCHEFDESNCRSSNICKVSDSFVQNSARPCDWKFDDVTLGGLSTPSPPLPGHPPFVAITNAALSAPNQSPLHLVDGDSMDLNPFLAPLARPESSVTTYEEEGPVANDGDQGDSESAKRSTNVESTTRSSGTSYPCFHRSSQLTARTLSGAELKQLNLWKRQLLSRTDCVTHPFVDAIQLNETPILLDKDLVEVESHRYFELPGTRRRRRLLWAGFRASQRRWESLEQAATITQWNSRLRQCITAGGHLDSMLISDGTKLSQNRHTPSPSPLTTDTFRQPAEFRPRRGSVSLPELLDSADAQNLASVAYVPNENVLDSQLSTRHLIRPDGSVLDHVPPVFAELDILTCKSSGERSAADECAVTGAQFARKASSQSMTPIPRLPESGHHVTRLNSAGSDRIKWSWLEAARWVRYEQDFDPVTGAFGQAHSPPLTFQAVVECRRYLEQGAILFPADYTDKTNAACGIGDDLCDDSLCLFSEVHRAINALGTDCGASTSEVALIRRVLSLRHQHVSDLRAAQHHSLFQPCTGLIPSHQTHGDNRHVAAAEDQSNHLTSMLPNFLIRSRPKTTMRQTSTSVDLQSSLTGSNRKRTTSVPIMEHRSPDVEHGLSHVATHPSVGGNLAKRAVSLLRRAFTPTSLPTCAPSGRNATAPVDQEFEVQPNRSSLGVGSNHRPRALDPDTMMHKASAEALSKPQSDLAGRLKRSTEIVSVQVGVLPGLRRPMLAFLRLQRALFAPGLTELRDSHPVRFLILFLGPERRQLDYSEVGRVIATMMVDKAFRRTAYTAVCREDLLDGLRTFLDTTIVLPMLSDITPKSLLAMHDQLRLFRRHRVASTRATKTNYALPPSGVKSQRSQNRGSSKALDGGMANAASVLPISGLLPVPEVIITPPPMHESAAAARVKREMRWPTESRRTTGPESAVPLLQPTSIAEIRSADERTSHSSYVPGSNCDLFHSPSKKRRANASQRCRTNSARSSPTDLLPGPVPVDRPRKEQTHPPSCCRSLAYSLRSHNLGVALCTDLYAYRCRLWSDFVDPFRRKSRGDLGLVFAAVVFLYFVVLAPAVTFGALLVSNVSPTFSIPLCIFASGTSQCLFTLFGGQPLLIVGMTGPMLILETCIKLVCDVNQAPLGAIRLMVAIYTSIFGLLAVLFNAGWLVLRVRRSLEEVFNFFVSFYFIFKALKILLGALFHPPLSVDLTSIGPVETIQSLNRSDELLASRQTPFNSNDSRTPVDLLVSFDNSEQIHYQQNQARAIAALLLAVLMFSVCSWLQAIKRGRYFRRTVRNLFGYFNVPIGLFCTVCVNRFFFAELNTATVQMPPTESLGLHHLIAPPPEVWSPTSGSTSPAKHTSPLANATYHGLAAMMAACLLPAIATDTMLSGITVAKSERRLRKPCLFSLDLVITVSIMPLVSGVLGWPFFSPATVRSNTHVIALTKWNTRTPPGVPHRIIGCVEQRVTGIAIGLLVALSVTLEARLFALVPMGALYGLFLYMGVMGLRDLVIVRRLCALLKRHKHWKDREYLRHLPPSVLVVFVTIQLTFIGWLLVMNWITEFARIGSTSLVFPFILLTYAITRECILPRCTMLCPHLEHMDRLHRLRLPRPRHCDLCCSSSHPGHALSSDDEEDGPGGGNGNTSVRGSQTSMEKLAPASSTAILKSDWLVNRPDAPVVHHADRAVALKSLEEQTGLNACGWTVSSRLDAWVDEDNEHKDIVGNDEPAYVAPSHSWNRFRHKLMSSFTHPTGDVDKRMSSSHHGIDEAQFPMVEFEHIGSYPEENSPLLLRNPRDDVDDLDEEFIQQHTSASQSSLEEYSESELEIRLDNPFWLD